MLTFCDPVTSDGERGHRCVNEKDSLTFLCKLRQGLSNDFLKIIFNYSSRQADTIPFHDANDLRSFYPIAGAILNGYRNTILMDGANAERAKKKLARANIYNDLRICIEDEGLRRGNLP
ncbi:hypothetical protein HHI36_004652 [Cryptolaemus montrouzieri]|uniref:Uncharacterized protein n=1 Tax=Cryptolaemus montrouzieri TaxID=559131 RepID=A0ABD2NRU2_9CUCU